MRGGKREGRPVYEERGASIPLRDLGCSWVVGEGSIIGLIARFRKPGGAPRRARRARRYVRQAHTGEGAGRIFTSLKGRRGCISRLREGKGQLAIRRQGVRACKQRRCLRKPLTLRASRHLFIFVLHLSLISAMRNTSGARAASIRWRCGVVLLFFRQQPRVLSQRA